MLQYAVCGRLVTWAKGWGEGVGTRERVIVEGERDGGQTPAFVVNQEMRTAKPNMGR